MAIMVCCGRVSADGRVLRTSFWADMCVSMFVTVEGLWGSVAVWLFCVEARAQRDGALIQLFAIFELSIACVCIGIIV